MKTTGRTIDNQQHTKLCQLFRLLNEAELKSQQIRQHSIVLMGLSRAGKSAVTNWIFNPDLMVGEKVGTNIFYVPVDSQNPQTMENTRSMAKIGHGFASVTIMANMREKEVDTQRISFLDFGGFGERRDAFEIIKVNYVLASFLLKVSKIKFILVVTQHAFNDISSNGFRDTLGQFLRLFDFDQMTEQEKQGFFLSVSLCITSTSRKYEESEIVQQLKIIISNFQHNTLYNAETNQNTYIEKYPICRQLLNELIQTKRFEFFPLAEVKKPPAQSLMIQNLNRKNWEYFELEKCKYTICYPYVEQYHKLKEAERTKLDGIIMTKFQANHDINAAIKPMLSKLYEDITASDLKVEQQLTNIEQIIQRNNVYSDMPQQFSDQTPADTRISWVQRVRTLVKLYKLCESLLIYGNWIVQVKREQTPVSLLEYYKYLKEWFESQMSEIECLFGQTPKLRQLFKRVLFFLCKSFNQALILDNLTRNIEQKGSDIADSLRMKLLDNAAIANQFSDSVKSIKLHAFRQLHKREVADRQISQQQAKEIIAQVLSYQEQEELQEIDTAQTYFICYKFSLIAAREIIATKGIEKYEQVLNTLIEGIDFCIKQHICLKILENEAALKKLHQYQKKFISQILTLLERRDGQKQIEIAFKICKSLKQHSLTENIYKHMMAKQPKNQHYLRKFAEFYLEIGRQKEAIRCYSQFLTPKDLQFEIKQIKCQGGSYYQKFQQAKKEQSEVMPIQSLISVVNLINKQLLGQHFTYFVNIQRQADKYKRKLKKIIQDRTFTRVLTKNPKSYQLFNETNALFQLITGKRVTIMLKSKSGSGQTTLAYALTNSALTLRQQANKCFYQLLEAKDSKINNDGKSPTQYPFLRLIENDQVLVDFLNVNQNNIQKKLINTILLQKLIQNSQQSRFLLVQTQKEFLQTNGLQLVKLLNMLLKCVDLRCHYNQEFLQKIAQSFFLAVNCSKDTRVVIRRIQGLMQRFSNKSNLIDNQRQYGLDEKEQQLIAKILKYVVCNARMLFFRQASRDERIFKRLDWIRQMQKRQFDCRTCIRLQIRSCRHKNWSYLDKSYFKERITTQIINHTFIQGQVQTLAASIANKIELLNKLFSTFFKVVQKDFHNRSKLSAEKQLFVYRNLFEMKYFFAKNSQEYCLPEQYHLYFEILKRFRDLFFKHIKQNCTSMTWDERKIIENEDNDTLLLEELQEYSEKLGLCNKQALRFSINLIRDLEMMIQGSLGKKYFEELLSSFFSSISLQTINSNPNAQQRQRQLLCYDKILCIIQQRSYYEQVDNYIPSEELLRIRKELKEEMVKTYKQLHRKKELVAIQIEMVKELCDQHSKTYQDPKLSAEKLSSTKIEEIRGILMQIADEIVLARPEIAKQICVEIGSTETLENIYEKIYQTNSENSQKIQTMVKRIDLMLQIHRAEKANTLHKTLLALISKTNPLYQEIATVDKVRDYVERNNLRLILKSSKSLRMKGLKSFVLQLQNQII